MYMPELGTTLLRSKSLLSRVAAGLFLLGIATAQTTPAPQGTPPPAGGSAAPSAQTAQPMPSAPPAGQAATPNQGSGQAAPPSSGQTGQGQDQGQAPAGNDNGGFVFRAEAREVTLHATVVDDKNHLVNNLDKGDFTVFENNQPQKITHFHQEDFPVAIGIVIDNSGSMREKRDAVNKAAINLVKASNPQDQVFVVNFNDEYYLDQEFTSDISKLQAALEHVEARGGTALYDAIVASADYLTHSPLQRKAIFVVTDGEDDASQESLEQAVHKLQQENGPVVYAIGLLGEEKSRRAKRALELISERTGGISFFPPTLDQVDEISRSVAHDIRNQYTISYAPSTPKTVQGYRTIHVDAHAKAYKKLTVRTRTGYYPGQEQQGAGGSY
ncbi:MAG TPA: VWA domain-containing protein [Candidatus Acidoferrales bacterium]|nr:VWA domain-containing protein [Candidatus Acidoferrales bacterium]